MNIVSHVLWVICDVEHNDQGIFCHLTWGSGKKTQNGQKGLILKFKISNKKYSFLIQICLRIPMLYLVLVYNIYKSQKSDIKVLTSYHSSDITVIGGSKIDIPIWTFAWRLKMTSYLTNIPVFDNFKNEFGFYRHFPPPPPPIYIVGVWVKIFFTEI